VGLILIVHYNATLQHLALHDFLRRLFYVPVIVAAIAGGMHGGLVTAGIVVIGYIPHLRQLAFAGDRVLDHTLELILLPVIAMLVGGFADSTRRARALAEERGRLAALGEVGLAIMVQAEGPLASIEGQAETLASVANRKSDSAVGFSAAIILGEVLRARRFLVDLAGLSSRENRRPTRIDLSTLVVGIVQEVSTNQTSAPRVIVGKIVDRMEVLADPSVLAFSLRSLLLGVIGIARGAGQVEVSVLENGGRAATVNIALSSSLEPIDDLESSLKMVFRADVSEYRFRQALCLHFLTSEGASVNFASRSRTHPVVRIRFPRLMADHSAHGHKSHSP
jgi:hypothetical protein